MSNMQSKQDNAESFNWYLKTLKEEQDKNKSSIRSVQEGIDPKIEANLLRFIKVFTPSVERLLEFCKAELNVSLIEATDILDKLENDKDIFIEDISKSSSDTTSTQVIERIVRITEKGLKKL